jgi:hypothetical protein
VHDVELRVDEEFLVVRGDGQAGDDDVEHVLPLRVVGVHDGLAHCELRPLHRLDKRGTVELNLALPRLGLFGQFTLLLVAQALLALAAHGGAVVLVVVVVVSGGSCGVAVLGEDVVAVQRRTHACLLLRICQRRRGIRSGFGGSGGRRSLVAAHLVHRRRLLCFPLGVRRRRGLCRCLRPRSRGLFVQYPLLLRRLRRLLGLDRCLCGGLGVRLRLLLPGLLQLELQLGLGLGHDGRGGDFGRRYGCGC